MNLSHKTIPALLAIGLSLLSIPPAVAAGRAALVEQTLPSRPYSDSANGSINSVSVGPGASGVLGVSALTLTNLGSTSRTIFVFAPVFQAGFTCGSSNIIGGGFPRFYVVVPANQTVHLTYPTPLVFPGISGQSCVGVSGAANIDITVTGLVN